MSIEIATVAKELAEMLGNHGPAVADGVAGSVIFASVAKTLGWSVDKLKSLVKPDKKPELVAEIKDSIKTSDNPNILEELQKSILEIENLNVGKTIIQNTITTGSGEVTSYVAETMTFNEAEHKVKKN